MLVTRTLPKHLSLFPRRPYSTPPSPNTTPSAGPSINPSIVAALKAATPPKKPKDQWKARRQERLEKQQEERSNKDEAQLLADLEKMLALQRRRPEIDIWARHMSTMDVHIPLRIFPPNTHFYQNIPAKWKIFKDNLRNSVKNIIAMYTLATANLVPCYHIPYAPWYSRIFTWIPNYFFIDSRGPGKDTWLAPFKTTAMDMYKSVCESVATRNERRIRQLTSSSYQSDTLKITRERFSSSSPASRHQPTYKWTLHTPHIPPRIVSIRAADAMLDPVMPKTGSRLLLNVCVRIESVQSLQMTNSNHRGVVMTSSATPGGLPSPSSSSSKKRKRLSMSGSSAIQQQEGTKRGDEGPRNREVEGKRVVEYLVFEKKCWYDDPWVIKERIWVEGGCVGRWD